jgi:D-glycero-alpha-D-manno-heptose-7-phosphate kinase
MKVTVSTPTRIDLAGGTLDIYPLYVFEGGGITVNCAIDLTCSVEVSPRKDAQIVIYSADLDLEVRGASIKELVPEGPLDLVARAVRFCAPRGGLNIVTRNTVPKGSGLGASSSLLVALMWALSRDSRKVINPGTLIDWCANVEAQSLGIPTGKQDYYAAFYGGLNAIFFDERGIKREPLKVSRDFMETLQTDLVLSYTGISHFSGATNWDMMKSYIDNAGATRAHMKKIKQTAFQMRDSLLSEDIKAVAAILAEEWENRKLLAEGVSNEMIDNLISGAAKAGALASKICGAGAGGCMVTITVPEKRQAVEKALEERGARVLHFSLQQKGLKIVEDA